MHDVVGVVVETHLLHDTSLSLGEGDVATRFVLDELDLDLATLTAALIVIIIVVVGSTDARTLGASRLGAIASAGDEIVMGRRRVLLSDSSDISHCAEERMQATNELATALRVVKWIIEISCRKRNDVCEDRRAGRIE